MNWSVIRIATVRNDPSIIISLCLTQLHFWMDYGMWTVGHRRSAYINNVARIRLWHCYAYGTVTLMTLWRLWHCYAYDTVTPMALWRLWHCDAYGSVTPMALWRLWHCDAYVTITPANVPDVTLFITIITLFTCCAVVQVKYAEVAEDRGGGAWSDPSRGSFGPA